MPANLLLADNFLLKICDFGITRRDCEAGMLCGTPGSPAPEQRATTSNKAFKLSPNGDGLAQLFQRTQTSDSRDRPSATEMLELYSMLGEMWRRHSKAPEHQAMAVAPEAIRNNGEKVRFLEELKFYTRALWCLNDWENFEDERRSVRLYFLEKLLVDVEERHETFFPVFFFSYEDEEHRGVYLGREVDDLHINGLNEPWLGDHGLMQRATGTVRMIPFAALMPALLLLYGNLLAKTNCGRIKHLLAALWEDTRPPWESSYPSRNLYKEDQERQAKECEEESGPDEYAQSRLSRAYTI
ncbi:unnamed protein product, partial [Mesorhabditis spiculigera]